MNLSRRGVVRSGQMGGRRRLPGGKRLGKRSGANPGSKKRIGISGSLGSRSGSRRTGTNGATRAGTRQAGAKGSTSPAVGSTEMNN